MSKRVKKGIFCDGFKANPKKFWSHVKSKRCEATGVSPLKQNGITHINPKAKANILNNQFASVFTIDGTSDLPDLGPSPYPSMEDITITNQGIVKLLKNLNPHKATGPDGVPAKLLKVVAEEIAPAITLLYQASEAKRKNDSE